MSLPVCYMAHPVGLDGPERAANLARAHRWLRYLIATKADIAFAVPWLPYRYVLDESPPNRERGLRDDMAMLARCDMIALVGGRISAGMADERDLAVKLGLPVLDYTSMGEEPP